MTEDALKVDLAARLYSQFVEEYGGRDSKKDEDNLRKLAESAFVATEIFLDVVQGHVTKAYIEKLKTLSQATD